MMTSTQTTINVQLVLPDVGVRFIERTDIYWFRKTLPYGEVGLSMIRTREGCLYSSSSIHEIVSKCLELQMKITPLLTPNGEVRVFVNSTTVVGLMKANPAVNHEKARSVVFFPNKVTLAVRQSYEALSRAINFSAGYADFSLK